MSKTGLPIAVDTVFLVLRGEAETTHPWFRWAAVRAGLGNGVTDTPIGQPASVAAVQSHEPPGGVELAHRGDVSAIIGARLNRLCEVVLMWVLQEVHCSYKNRS